MYRLAFGLSAIFTALASSASATITLPGPTWSSYTSAASQNNPTSRQQLDTSAPNTSTSGSSTGSLTFGNSPVPYVNATASSSSTLGPGGGSAGAAQSNGDLTYYLEIVGPASANTVQLGVSAYGYASNTSPAAIGAVGGQANAYLTLNFYGGPPYLAAQSWQAVSNNGAPTSYINVNELFPAYVNEPIFVSMHAAAYAGSAVGPGGGAQTPFSSASAYIDPYFSLSQSLLDAGYQIEVSSGVGNSPIPPSAPGPVPGFGLAGLAALALAGFYAKTRHS